MRIYEFLRNLPPDFGFNRNSYSDLDEFSSFTLDEKRSYAQLGNSISKDIGFVSCLICKKPFSENDPKIDSHSVSKTTLDLLKNEAGKVSYLSTGAANATNFNVVRRRFPASAGTYSMIHQSCDLKVFSPYEQGDFETGEGALSLVRKIAYSEMAKSMMDRLQYFKRIIATNTQLWREQEKILLFMEQDIDTQTYLTIRNRIEKILKKRIYTLNSRYTSELSLFRMMETLNSDNLFWTSRAIESEVPLAFQGFLHVKHFQDAYIFVAYLPQPGNKARFFIASNEIHSSLLMKIGDSIPIVNYAIRLAAKEGRVFWNSQYLPKALEDVLAKEHLKPMMKIKNMGNLSPEIFQVISTFENTKMGSIKMSLKNF